MAIDHFHSRSWRGTLALLVLLSHLGTVPSLFAAPLQPPNDSRRLYDRVMEEFRHKDYDAALAGFRFFLELHRQSALSANAQYWMGECQYRMGHFKDALESFYNVISYYPLSQKLAASTLKIGQIYARQGDRENAQSDVRTRHGAIPRQRRGRGRSQSPGDGSEQGVNRLRRSRAEPSRPSPTC